MSHSFEANSAPICTLRETQATMHAPVSANTAVVAGRLYASGNVVCQPGTSIQLAADHEGYMVQRQYGTASDRYGIAVDGNIVRMYAAGNTTRSKVALSFATSANTYTDAVTASQSDVTFDANVVMSANKNIVFYGTPRNNMLQLYGAADASQDQTANIYTVGVEPGARGTLRLQVPDNATHRFYTDNVLTAQFDKSKTWFYRDLQVQRANLSIVGSVAEPKMIDVNGGVTRVAYSTHRNNKVCVGAGAGADIYDQDETRVWGLGTELNGLIMRAPVDTGFFRFKSNTETIALLSYGVLSGGVTGTSGRLRLGGTSGFPQWHLWLEYDSAYKPGGGSWTTSSDERVKTDIELANLDMCWDTVKALPLKRFEWREPASLKTGDRTVLGWIAQDVQRIMPKAVSVAADHGIDDLLTLDQDQILKTMYGALQKAVYTLDTLEPEVHETLAGARAIAARG